MFRNYFKIAFRSLSKNRAFSLINILGLAAGLSTCLLILFYISDEQSFDKRFTGAEQVFRVASVTSKGETWAAGPGPLAAGLKGELPEVEEAARLLTFPDISTMLIKYEQGDMTKQFFETNGYYVDSNFFRVISFNLVYGHAPTALNDPNTTVISTELSEKIFGTENPIGKAILITTPFGEFSYSIRGVFDKEKNKSHIPVNFFLSMRNKDMWNWVQGQTRWTTNNIFFTYIKVKDETNVAAFEKKVNTLFLKYAGADMKSAGFSKALFLQPFSSIYLHSSLGNEIGANGNITYLYILGSIAGFILLIACINFMNLSTARSEKRAREVGVRKVLGAMKGVLVRQFLGESFVMCSIALFIALALVWALLPVFNQLTLKNMQFSDQPHLIIWLLALTFITGLLSGLYPAFYLSAFKPISVLKGRILNSFSATMIRKGLVIFQFTVSICLIFGAIVTRQQLDLFRNQELGFNRERQIVLPLQQAFKNSESNYIALRNDLLKQPGVSAVTAGSSYPGIPNLNDLLFYAEGKTSADFVDILLTGVESGYTEALGIKLVSGRTFSQDFRADSASIILNETAIRRLGYQPDLAIGKKIQYDFAGNHSELQIVGVMKDFNFESLHNEIKPCGFTSGLFSNKHSFVIVSLKGEDYGNSLKTIEKSWHRLIGDSPFVYSFMDQDFQRNYEREQRTGFIIIYFTVVAILIACLGLFGLSAFSAERRIKEIGIRKVLGASIGSVTRLLSGDFVRLIIVAIVIALPLSWFIMNRWLQDFAYRVTLSWWMFVVAGSVAVVIALITISFQAIKAAVANPVESLRAE